MRFRLYIAPVLSLFFFCACTPAFSQAAPAATRGDLPLVIGAGFSNYNIDWGGGRREDGGTAWGNWTFRNMPGALHGLGVAVEVRDLVINPPADLSFFQYETIAGGAIYHYMRLRNIHPYAKGYGGFGRVKFLPGYPPGTYNSDTRAFYAFGGGADFHVWRHVWVRADYEYQIWQHLFGSQHSLTPNGFTIGPEYDFGRIR